MRVTRTRIYQTDDACLDTDQPALLPPSASAATSTAMADATRMCDVALRRRGAVWESMLNAGRRGEPMKSDTQIRDDVIEELRWDPQITEPDAIGVAVTDGAVTLTGSVATSTRRSWRPRGRPSESTG